MLKHIKPLTKQFVPVVATMVDPIIAEVMKGRAQSIHKEPRLVASYRVMFVENMSTGKMYHVVVTLHGTAQLDELRDIETALQAFGCCEDAPWVYDGLNWSLGDGDDSLAVSFVNGTFRVWLRGFKE